MKSTITIRNRPTMCEVLSTHRMSDNVKTLQIKCPPYICRTAQPGQFLMIWIPSVDEVPMSISNVVGEDEVWITVKKVGEATSAIHETNEGEMLGLRGPYGNGFSITGDNILVAGGGIGAAPLLFLTKRLVEAKKEITAVLGERSAEKLALHKDFEKLLQNRRGSKLMIVTDDGSIGVKGLAGEVAQELIRKGGFDKVFTCGPEPMIRKVTSIAMSKGIHAEACLERYMRCGIGICGSCYVGKHLVCRDGPVFSGVKLKEIVKYLEMK